MQPSDTFGFTRKQLTFLKALLVWLISSSSLILLLNLANPIGRARIGMAYGLILLWVFLCGGMMLRHRDSICSWVSARRLDWRVKFVLFCTALALTEEAIAVLMTNTAPLYGLRIGQAYVTASSNYIDVITLHSVSLFISFFVGWAVVLRRIDFSPFAVVILFGITGTLAEMLFSGPLHILEYGMWAYIYGLMIWLPACCIPRDRGASLPRWWHYPMAVFVPFLFMLLFPLMGLISLFHPNHPRVHFP